MNFMGSSKRRVLVHKDMENIDVKESIDIVLTPQFYTFLREDLEIKFAYQAKKIAPAFFDDYLNAGVEHQYHVYKHGSEWYFFAYSVEEITMFLEERGISSHQIGKIYFAQELEQRLEHPVELGETMVMQTVEGTVTLLPKRLLSTGTEYQPLNLQKEKFKNGITISSSYDSIVPFKETALLSTLLFFLGAFFLFEGERGRSAIERLELSKTELLEKNPRLSSSLQRNSEMKKYTKIDQEERVKREALMQVSKMISNSNRLKSLVLNEKTIMATIRIDAPVAMKRLKKLAKKRNFRLLNERAKEISVEKKL